MPPHTQIDLIIFDQDGTLVDSTRSVWRVLNHVLAQRGRPTVEYTTLQGMMGFTLAGILQACGFDEAKQHQEAMNEFREAYTQTPKKDVTILSGVMETLTHYKNRKRMTIATNKPSSVAATSLQAFAMEHFFELVVGIDMVAQPKPHPETIYLTLERTGIDPARASIVGDSITDVETGKRAGITTIAVATGAHSAEELATAAPDYIITSLQELRHIIP